MDFTDKLGSFADRRTFQGTELSWRSDRRSGHHLDCPGSRRAVYLHFCAGSDCVVYLAGDCAAAQQSKQGSVIPTAFSTSSFNSKQVYWEVDSQPLQF